MLKAMKYRNENSLFIHSHLILKIGVERNNKKLDVRKPEMVNSNLL